jgi:hypothetical protein
MKIIVGCSKEMKMSRPGKLAAARDSEEIRGGNGMAKNDVL